MFKSLAAATVLNSTSYENIKHLINKAKNPKPNLVTQRFHFSSRNRADSQTMSEYIAELQRLTQYCDYGTVLKEMLGDKLVCGVNHSQIQQKLLSEGSSLHYRNPQALQYPLRLLLNNHY